MLGEKLALLPGASAWAVSHLCPYHHSKIVPEHKGQWESLWVQGIGWQWGACLASSRQGSLETGGISRRNVWSLNSEQFSGCLEAWDRLEEEVGTGRICRRSGMSQQSSELAMPKSDAAAKSSPRNPPRTDFSVCIHDDYTVKVLDQWGKPKTCIFRLILIFVCS